MTTGRLFAAVVTAVVAGGLVAMVSVHVFAENQGQLRQLPEAREEGPMSLEKALAARRSIREYTPEPLSDEQIAQLCWSAQGISEPQRELRTAPSAGATYPLELYVVTAEGVSRYVPQQHALERHKEGDLRGPLSAAALNQPWVARAPAVFVFAGVIERTERRYGDRAERYTWIEVGHAAQNLLLSVTAMDLGAVPVGAFSDERVSQALSLPRDHRPLYVVPVGHLPEEQEEPEE